MRTRDRLAGTPSPPAAAARLRAPDPLVDATTLFTQLHNPEVSRYLVLQLPASIQTFAQRLADFCADPAERIFVITREADDGAIGVIRMHLHTSNAGEVLYWLGREHWGKGYAFSALSQFTKYAFMDLKLSLLLAYCYVGNSRSISLLDRSGFKITEAHRLAAHDPSKGQEACFKLTLAQYLRADSR